MICRNHSRTPVTPHRVLFAALVASFASGSWAACSDASSGNPAVTASAGSTCNASFTAYTGNNIAGAYENGSVLNLLAGTTITTLSNSGTYTLSSGGMNIGGIGQQPAAALVHGLGNLSITSRGANSRGIYVYGGESSASQRSKLQVDRDLVVMRSVGAGGAVVENTAV